MQHHVIICCYSLFVLYYLLLFQIYTTTVTKFSRQWREPNRLSGDIWHLFDWFTEATGFRQMELDLVIVSTRLMRNHITFYSCLNVFISKMLHFFVAASAETIILLLKIKQTRASNAAIVFSHVICQLFKWLTQCC